MRFVYALSLLISLGSMMLVDYRWRLFFWHSPLRAAVTLAVGVGFFLVWDIAGIALGIFVRGDAPWMTGWDVAPELPVEELLFLTFLCHLTMVVATGVSRLGAGKHA